MKYINVRDKYANKHEKHKEFVNNMLFNGTYLN